MNGALLDRLIGVERIHIDSVILIYFIERHPKYSPFLLPLFEAIQGGSMIGITSSISLLEVLVKPLKEGRSDLANQYKDILLHAKNMRLYSVDQAVAEEGAGIRARYKLRTPDALQLATACLRSAQAFLTNDHDLRAFAGCRVVILDDLLGGPESSPSDPRSIPGRSG